MSRPRVGSRWWRLLADLVLGLWLDREERGEVLEDLDALAEEVRQRKGRAVAAIWFGWELLQYPRYLIGVGAPDRPLPSPLLVRRGSLVGSWTRELRLGARRVMRRPGPSAVIVLTLAIGIGVSTAVFSVLNELVLRPLPFAEPDRLVRIRDLIEVQSGAPRETVMSPARFEAVRDRSESFEDVAAARYRTFTLGGDGEPERIIGLTATWNHFTVLGVPASLGRTYTAAEDAPGSPAAVVVISESLWTRRFGRSQDAVGSELLVDGRPHTVLGVMPAGFRYPYAGEAWIPMGIDPAGEDYRRAGLNITGRLADGVSVEAARAELAALGEVVALEGPEDDRRRRYTFKSISEEVLEGMPRKIGALLGAAFFVLLIGAANVASMILARLHAEERELNVQVALGAGREDLLRRFVAESLVLSLAGLAIGLVLSSSTVGFLTRLSPVDDLGPYFQDFGVDVRVAAFGAALALGAVALASLPTVFKLRGGAFAGSLRTRTSTQGRRLLGLGFLDLLVAGELAMAVLLLTGAGLTLQSVRAEWNAELGIRPEALYTVSVAPTSSGYADEASRVAYLEEVATRAGAVAGVESVGYTNLNPLRSQGWGNAVLADGADPNAPGALRSINHRAVSPGYFPAAGTRIIEGRALLPSDGPTDPAVAVISRKLAESLWPGERAVGRHLRVASPDGQVVSVVGVAEDVREFDFLDETWYRPYAQMPGDYNTLVVELFVRVEGASGGSEASTDPGAVVMPAVREAIREVDPRVAVFRTESMEEVLRFERRVESFGTLLLGLFAGIGLLMAAVGIYGVLSYVTGRRTREIGLRVALGARRGDVVRNVTGRTMRTCAVGLMVGLLSAAVLARVMESLVVEVSAFSPTVYGAAALGVLGIAALASAVPALRALRVQPRTALAEE